MVEVYPVLLNLKLYDRNEEMQCSFSKTSQISNLFYMYCEQTKNSKKGHRELKFFLIIYILKFKLKSMYYKSNL